MVGKSETVISSETLEFDLEALLQYFRVNGSTSSKSQQTPENDLDSYPVISRVIMTQNICPVRLDTNVLSAFSGTSPQDGKFSMDTDHFELTATGRDAIVLSLISKPKSTLKRKTLMSLAIQGDRLSHLIASEIRFLGNKIRKCRNHLQVSELHWHLELDTISNTVSTQISYRVDMRAMFYRYFSSDIISALLKMMAPELQENNPPRTEELSKLQNLPMDKNLFYRAIIENTSRLPRSGRDYHHRYLLTQLLPFQKRSVEWLLKREGVTYDANSGLTTPMKLITDEMYQNLRSFPNCDTEVLDSQLYECCNKLCFGWKRFLHKDNVCWINLYTGNVLGERQLIKFFTNYYEENNETKLPGSGLLSEEMGLGKTVEIVSLVLFNRRSPSEVGVDIPVQLNAEEDLTLVKSAKTTLIAAPQAILQQWYNEICRLCPSLSVTIYKGLGKYPELFNLPRLIADYLSQYDIVLMNYDTMSKETDNANYSSRRKQTRASRKRDANSADIDDSTDKAQQTETSDVRSDHPETKNVSEEVGPDVESYQAKFQLYEPESEADMMLNQKRFDRAIMATMMEKLQSENLNNIPHTDFYDSPLMLRQWWRVILDEVQMVSYGASRAFVTASLIPRFHSWGVSGTPYRSLSVLQFLKYSPFNYDISNFCWKQLNNESDGSSDFIDLWQTLAIRHTKAMVYDDINLPPQERILLTIPFTEIEQDKYSQLLDSVLASIGVHDKESREANLKSLTSSDYAHLRSYLVKLRQLCGNSQVGRLSKLSGKTKGKNAFLINGESELKTLESVLDDMIKTVGEEIKENEKVVIAKIIGICQSLEYVFYPENVIEILQVISRDINRSLEGVKELRASDMAAYDSLKAKLMSLGKLGVQDFEEYSDDDEEYSDTRYTRVKSELIDAGVISTDADADFSDDMARFKEIKESLQAHRVRIRSWRILQHKTYFLLGSAYFQLYDEKYQEKMKNLKVSFPGLNHTMKSVNQCRLYDHAEAKHESGVFEADALKRIECDPSLSEEEQTVEKYKHLESLYYELSEKCREDILKHSIKEVSNVLSQRFNNRTTINRDKWINDGSSLLPKSSKSLFIEIPLIDTSGIKDLIGSFKSQKIADQFIALSAKLNDQANVINDFTRQLYDVLQSPLLGADEKKADGDEYEQSIQDQDKAASLLLVITHLLMDRSNVVLDSKSSISEMTLQQDRDYKTEAQHISDRAFLRELNKLRNSVKIEVDTSLEELTQDCRIVEIELKTPAKMSQFDIFARISAIIKNTFENEKSCGNIFKKELNTSFNAVFNARVEYFKQLQSISDTVKDKKFGFSQEELDSTELDKLFQGLSLGLEKAKNAHTRSVSRLRYLSTLKPKMMKNEGQETNQDETICIICQMPITVGSLTSCGHKFCKECLEEWLVRHPTCPMCKTFTNRNTIYSFTQYKTDIRGKKIVSEGEKTDEKSEMNQIYKSLDSKSLNEIQNVKLSNSYGSKVDLIVKQVLHLVKEDPQVQIVIFSQWQDLLVILAFAFDKVNIKYVSAKGSEVAGYKKRKTDPVEDFKNQTNIKTCFLLNAQAQSSGLNLINATHIFLCEPLINTSTELQAISRIHRIGQKKVTTVWMFAIENSVEENIVTLGAKKRSAYLEANARDNSEGQHGHSSDEAVLREKDLRDAESLALTLNSVDAKKYSGENETTEDNDVHKIYFGFN